MHCPSCGSSHVVRSGTAGSGHQRWACKSCGHRTTNPNQRARVDARFSGKLPDCSRFVVTSAQNATPVFKPFLQAIEHYCAHIGAELIVIPFRYKNPTSNFPQADQAADWWDPALAEYLYEGRFNLGPSLTILADVKVQPTATRPLSALESITGERSGIIGHPKIQFQSIATPQNKLPKIMVTTGCVTRPNYTDSKAGKKGEFHHSFGATVVEVKGKTFHLRQAIATRDGSFIDLDVEAKANGCFAAPPAEALVTGDTHVDFVDPAVVAATYTGPDSIVGVLKPKRIIFHDLLDFHSRNHHHRKNPFTQVAKHKSGREDVRQEIERAIAFVETHVPAGAEAVIVASNHIDALPKWLAETDWRTDPVNAKFYLETALAMVESAHVGPQGVVMIDPFVHWAKQRLNAKFLSRDQSYNVKGVELSLHGDAGPNGARGAILSFARIGARSVVAHGHSPGIEEGCYQVGTSTYLKLEYSRGSPSSWLNTHCAIYANGKRSLISVIDGAFRLPPEGDR